MVSIDIHRREANLPSGNNLALAWGAPDLVEKRRRRVRELTERRGEKTGQGIVGQGR